MRRQYPFNLIEAKWQRHWENESTFRAWNPSDSVPSNHPFAKRHHLTGTLSATSLPPKFYVLDMFPYPSGAGLHVGHPEGYTATDILARYHRALGFNVLHPIGWDAFGLPAEQYAIRTGQHPRVTTEKNIHNFTRQIKALGFSYDWSREVDTTNPKYFKWTQTLFLKLYNSWFNPASNKAESISTLTYPPELKTEEEKRTYRDSKRLAYVTEAPVWWCEKLGTVLANEEVVDGRSEVGGYPVTRKPMRQWMLRITAYAERLIEGLDSIDWSDSLKEMQRNWIGRSEGAEVQFTIAGTETQITVFTTRADTLFGATYMVLSPEHKLVDSITTAAQRDAVTAYKTAVSKKSDLERTELSKEKTGVFTGAYAINPVNNDRIPIWIADYVLASYGTGAIMAVPAHDERDLAFAQKFNLPIRLVVQAPDGKDSHGFVGDGTSINSGFITGLPTPEAKKKIIAWLESKGLGHKTVNFKLRDWLFSRQRYWGEPFPIIWKQDASGKRYHEALPESSLPLMPPEMTDFKPTSTGEPPLTRAKEWVNLPDGSIRETNTMPQWAGSCWYYLRYIDAQNDRQFCGSPAEQYWMGTQTNTGKKPTPGVDLYVGGIEHAVLHLLYARFWHKVLFDLGCVTTPEPFFKLVNQGLILGELEFTKFVDGEGKLHSADTLDISVSSGNISAQLKKNPASQAIIGTRIGNPEQEVEKRGSDYFLKGTDIKVDARSFKMSKSRGNVVNPDDVLREYGADSFRLYEMFMGPLEMVKPWSTKGVEGVYRFLGRVWRLFIDESSETAFEQAQTMSENAISLDTLKLSPAVKDVAPTPGQLKTLHSTIKKVTEDLDNLRFNTAISALMVFVNDAITWENRPVSVLRDFLVLLQPFSPHIAEELYSKLPGHDATDTSLAYRPWPKFNPALLEEQTIEIPVQINGKLRDRITVPAGATPAELEAAAKAAVKIKPLIAGKTIKKVVVVPKKMVNIVAI